MPQAARPILRTTRVLLVLSLAYWVLARNTGSVVQAKPGPSASVVGQWSAVQSWPVASVHAALLPTGKVLFYSYADDPRVWDPATGTIVNTAQVGYNVFCSGLTLLSDGRLFVAGGHINFNVGFNHVSIYNPSTDTWSPQPDMNAGRWYPTATTLTDGSVLVISGDIDTTVGVNLLPQVWSNGTWRDLTSAQIALGLYPFMLQAPNGQVFNAGPQQTARYLDTSGSGSWTDSATSAGGYRSYGTAVMYEPGKVLIVGGVDPPIASAEAIDLNVQDPAWRPAGSMASARRHLNATVLPDGAVLVTGGSSGAGFDNAAAPVYAAERWDPATGLFTTLASATTYRGYHSIALLLPDGRVLSSGGDNQPSAELFSPPYLFKGARPVVSSSPSAIAYGQPFFVPTPNATSITAVTLVRSSAVTHAFNMNQRFLRLAFAQAAGGLNITAPPAAELAPPGDYMLFVLNGNGVPSAAPMIRVTAGPASPAAPSSLVATRRAGGPITLTWTDNASSESGFAIERSPDGRTFTQIATVGPDVSTYVDSTPGVPKNSYYRVRAFGAGGYSGYSNTAKI